MSSEDLASYFRRKCAKGMLDLIVLATIRAGASALGAYGIISQIYAKFGILINPGTIYPVLSSLEGRGLIKGMWAGRRTVYQLTEKGQESIRVLSETYGEVYRGISEVLGEK